MNTPAPRSLLGDDTRAVAPVIGFILIFGILFVAFAGYQATTVPQQNQAAEFEHLQDVENDLVDVRRAILRAGQSDVREFATVQLGMSYPTRLIALNPPQPTGTLQASESYNISITNETADPDTGETVNVSTRFLEYRPGYNELEQNSVWYENTVLYREANDNTIPLEDQELVTDGGTLEITALQNELREQGTGRIIVSLFPTREFTADEIPDGEIWVTIPTQLGEDYWNDAIEETEFDDDNFSFEESRYSDDVNAIEFELDPEETELKLNTVGIQSEPEEDETDPLKQGVGGTVGDEHNEDPEEFDLTVNVVSSGAGSPRVDVSWNDEERTVETGETEEITIERETEVTLEAIIPGGSAEFDQWTGNIGDEDETNETITVRMDENKQITGEFE